MPQTQSEDDVRVATYVDATAKYGLAPVPTPLSRDEALSYIQEHLAKNAPVKHVRRLMRLAVFYDLRETASDFANLLNREERKPDDYRRSALSLVAIAWIGDEAECEQARKYFHRMLGRAQVANHVVEMEQVCDAFGSREGTKELKAWIEQEVEKLRTRLADQEQKGNQNEAELVGNRLATLEEHLTVAVPMLEQANATRAEIDAMKSQAQQIRKLTELYVDVLGKSTERLSYWAAMRLIRLGEREPTTKQEIIKAFEQQAHWNDKQGSSDMQRVYDINRARCLRAEEYFGRTLDEQHGEWLKKQNDVGADALALRPDWDYTAN